MADAAGNCVAFHGSLNETRAGRERYDAGLHNDHLPQAAGFLPRSFAQTGQSGDARAGSGGIMAVL